VAPLADVDVVGGDRSPVVLSTILSVQFNAPTVFGGLP
jgi:hypothetical protein